jgi:hypothetical protein
MNFTKALTTIIDLENILEKIRDNTIEYEKCLNTSDENNREYILANLRDEYKKLRLESLYLEIETLKNDALYLETKILNKNV